MNIMKEMPSPIDIYVKSEKANEPAPDMDSDNFSIEVGYCLYTLFANNLINLRELKIINSRYWNIMRKLKPINFKDVLKYVESKKDKRYSTRPDK